MSSVVAVVFCSGSRMPTPFPLWLSSISATNWSHISTNGNGDGAGHEEKTWARLPKFVSDSVSVSGLVWGVAGPSTLNFKQGGGSFGRRSFLICIIRSRHPGIGYRTGQARCLLLPPLQTPSHTCSENYATMQNILCKNVLVCRVRSKNAHRTI